MQQILKIFYLNQAHGQLIALIIIPISILMIAGTWIIYSEVTQNYFSQQRHVMYTILLQTRKQIEQELGERGYNNLDTKDIEYFLQYLLAEKNILSVQWISDKDNVHLGEPLNVQDNFYFYSYLKKSAQHIQTARTLDLIEVDGRHFYAFSLSDISQLPDTWLVIEVDKEELYVVQYRVILNLTITIFFILLFIFFTLFFYARHWLNPIYKIRLQIQRLTSENLADYKLVHSSGELWDLQQDIFSFLKRLQKNFAELRIYVQETEDDTRRLLDDMEMDLAKYQHQLKSVISINQSKSIFLANISHELRTPLNSIEGFVQLLLRQKQLGAEQRLYLETIKKSSSHLLALINDVLDYSKIEAGKLHLDLDWFNLENAMYDALDMLSPLATQKNLQLIFYYPFDVPTLVKGDELRFKQILTNLVSNAIKFTPDGEIIIRVRVEKKQQANYMLHFSVQDSGIGIQGQDKRKLFDSFNQADTSITRQYGGTGLGLAIAKRLTLLMQGDIGFYDNQDHAINNKGTTFWFTAQFQADIVPQIDIPRWRDIRVLYYLQNPATASVLRYYLDEERISYQEVGSALDFFALLKEKNNNPNQWVILDYSSQMHLILPQIRERYQGEVAVYGEQLSMDMDLLKRYRVSVLAQPIYRQALGKLFECKQCSREISTYQLNGQHLHILAVDDHMVNLLVLEALLQEFNIQLVKVNSGQDALNLIEQRIEQQQPLFDLIFMDIQMPIMSGFDTTRAIRSLEQTLDEPIKMPIVALSAYLLADEQLKLRECGMSDELVKPVQLDELLHILRKWTNIGQAQVNIMPTDMLMMEQTSSKLETYASSQILDWSMSLKLSAQKEDLALNLLNMLVANFVQEQNEIAELIELEDFPQLEQILHRIYGATHYVGTPQLQQITGEFEQFVSQLRKQQRRADDEFAQQVQQRFIQLKQAMSNVEQAVQALNRMHK
ncbi:ATP-binding protein [Moraxella sp. ZY210820]|uniref:ATP-binding protein n=1 Tax=Moraxella sp. ZY210820 TaxID=2904123 RepID=UPI002730C80D|nr:ATP-binding protein [Moraxella sp. ZY210820]WLF83670.1 ATP-binding protein [Moraxella sp. ZY210820]